MTNTTVTTIMAAVTPTVADSDEASALGLSTYDELQKLRWSQLKRKSDPVIRGALKNQKLSPSRSPQQVK